MPAVVTQTNTIALSCVHLPHTHTHTHTHTQGFSAPDLRNLTQHALFLAYSASTIYRLHD